MESIHDQPHQGLRTADFFDDTTDDDASTKAKMDSLDKSEKIESPKSPHAYLGGQPAGDYVTHCKDDEPAPPSPAKTSPSIIQGMDGFLRLTLTPNPKEKHKHWPRPPERPPRPEITVSDTDAIDFSEDAPVIGEAKPLSMHRPVSGYIIDTAAKVPSIIEDAAIEASAMAAVEATKDELIMNAHTQTLQALLRDETALQQTASRISFAPTDPESMAPHTSTKKKRVSLAPLPIDIPHGSLPDDLVRTPYPLHFRKVYTRPSPISTSFKIEHESILPLTIRRCGNHAHRPQRISHISLPADVVAAGTVDMTQASPAAKEKHFESLDWDDALFFAELRSAYRSLAGPYRFFSARSLQSIQVSYLNGSCGSLCSSDYLSLQGDSACRHNVPRSPRYLEGKGLKDSFSEEELIKHFRHPNLGKSKYAWVHWAKRLASCPAYLRSPAPAPPADSPATRLAKLHEDEESKNGDHEKGYIIDDCSASLEFLESWSWHRIIVAFIVVGALALATALCWILLGTNLQPFETGYRNAGERVTGGAVLGLFTLLMGWTWIAGWIILSSLLG